MCADFNIDLLNHFDVIQNSQLPPIFAKYDNLVHWSPNEVILDIGCGSGFTSKEFIYPLIPEDYSRYVCSDISQAMVQEAEKTFADYPKVFFQQLDIAKDLNETNIYDHIFSIWCLMWVSDHVKAFRNIYDLLVPGGGTYLIFVEKHIMIETILELLERPKWQPFVPNPREVYPFPYRNDPDPVASIKSMMEDIGFINVQVYLETNTFGFSSDEEFLGFLKALPNPLHLMTEEEQEEYLKEALEIGYANNAITDPT
ncbi:juvenile hormone acid O-methyltransferase-like [Lutzomyia longipalpis]|uniref:juvenile hormone acid O-methyltransferase-like n=1 Tax=Lutzomyia longipalpis TaxID=7200 RepID=UPI00248469C0|nr:juvenile hormone acid O-methyltransferase-like [Lutzomyia longipalpis]